MTEPRPLTHAEQREQGIDFPRANCRKCTVSYGLNRNDTVRRHGPYGYASCEGSNRPPLGMPDPEEQ